MLAPRICRSHVSQELAVHLLRAGYLYLQASRHGLADCAADMQNTEGAGGPAQESALLELANASAAIAAVQHGMVADAQQCSCMQLAGPSLYLSLWHRLFHVLGFIDLAAEACGRGQPCSLILSSIGGLSIQQELTGSPPESSLGSTGGTACHCTVASTLRDHLPLSHGVSSGS